MMRLSAVFLICSFFFANTAMAGNTTTVLGYPSGNPSVVCAPTATNNQCAGTSGGGWTLTDGTTTVSNVAQMTVTGGTVGGNSANATLLITGGTGTNYWLESPGNVGISTLWNVGIGSISPIYLLDVNGTSRIANIIDTGVTASTSVVTNGSQQFTAATYLQDVAYLPVTGATTGATSQSQTFTNGITVSDSNIVTDTTTGTKIGTATGQKLGFFNSTPIAQPSGDLLTSETNLGLNSAPTLSPADVGLGNVTNNAQVTSVGANLPLTSSGGTTPTIAMTANPFIQGNVGLGSTIINGSNGLVVYGPIWGGNVGVATFTVNGNELITGSSQIGTVGVGTFNLNGPMLGTGNANVGVGTINVGTETVTGLTASRPVITNSGSTLATGTYSGNTTEFCTVTGTLTSGDFIYADASGNCKDSGIASTSILTLSSQYWNLNGIGIGTGYPSNPQNVGLGTSTYGSTLSIIGNVGIGTNGSSLYILNSTATPPNGGMVIEGNVGIGTYATPNFKLSVMGTGASVGIGTEINANTSGLIVMTGNVGVGTWVPAGALQVGNGTNICSSGSNCFGGNMGVGTTSPTGALEVEGSNVGIGTTPAFSGNAAIGIGTEAQAVGETLCLGVGHCVGWCSGTITSVGGACSACSCLTHR